MLIRNDEQLTMKLKRFIALALLTAIALPVASAGDWQYKSRHGGYYHYNDRYGDYDPDRGGRYAGSRHYRKRYHGRYNRFWPNDGYAYYPYRPPLRECHRHRGHGYHCHVQRPWRYDKDYSDYRYRY